MTEKEIAFTLPRGVGFRYWFTNVPQSKQPRSCACRRSDSYDTTDWSNSIAMEKTELRWHLTAVPSLLKAATWTQCVTGDQDDLYLDQASGGATFRKRGEGWVAQQLAAAFDIAPQRAVRAVLRLTWSRRALRFKQGFSGGDAPEI